MPRLAICAGALVGLLLGPLVALAAVPGVQFVGPDPTVGVTAGSPAQFEIAVVNGSSRQETLSVWSAPARAGASPAPTVGASTSAGGTTTGTATSTTEPAASTAPTDTPTASAAAPPSSTAPKLLLRIPGVPAGALTAVHMDAGTPSATG